MTSFSNAGEKNGDSSSIAITGFVENAGGVSERVSAKPRVMRPRNGTRRSCPTRTLPKSSTGTSYVKSRSSARSMATDTNN